MSLMTPRAQTPRGQNADLRIWIPAAAIWIQALSQKLSFSLNAHDKKDLAYQVFPAIPWCRQTGLASNSSQFRMAFRTRNILACLLPRLWKQKDAVTSSKTQLKKTPICPIWEFCLHRNQADNQIGFLFSWGCLVNDCCGGQFSNLSRFWPVFVFEVLHLESPGEPTFWKPVHKQHQRLPGITSCHVVQLHVLNSQTCAQRLKTVWKMVPCSPPPPRSEQGVKKGPETDCFFKTSLIYKRDCQFWTRWSTTYTELNELVRAQVRIIHDLRSSLSLIHVKESSLGEHVPYCFHLYRKNK